jgi:predicted RNA-binding protein
MKKLLSAMAICVAVTLWVVPVVQGQEKAAPPAQAQAEKVFQGQLTKVDANGKMISVKGAGDMEMTFELTEATQVIGSERNVQGLAAKTGSDLKVTYRDAAGKHTATKIEIAEKR